MYSEKTVNFEAKMVQVQIYHLGDPGGLEFSFISIRWQQLHSRRFAKNLALILTLDIGMRPCAGQLLSPFDDSLQNEINQWDSVQDLAGTLNKGGGFMWSYRLDVLPP